MKAKKPRAPKLTVEVTEEQIKDSKKRDSSHCMIAESIKTLIPGCTHVSVDVATIRLTDPKKSLRYTYLTPRVAQVAIVNFDQGRLPEPFSFRLRGGQVTFSGSKHPRKLQRPLSEKEMKQRANATKRSAELAKARLAKEHESETCSTIPDKIGGQPPPLMKSPGSDVPFSRRREFGVKALSR